MIDNKTIGKIEKIVGKLNATAEKEDLICYSYDAFNLRYLPDLVVFPESAQEVSELLRLANEQGFPVVPRGAGSGLTGGSVPIRGGVVVSFERMNRILEIDEEDMKAVVEPGVVTADFHREVEKVGLFYPPDPASEEFSTLGGNVAECAGGLRAVKYGVTRDYVLGLELVLPTGEIVTAGVETVKGVVGYDLTRLIVGSEGTLGIVTKIILKLLPKPEARATLRAFFARGEDAIQTAARIIRERFLPATLEFMDGESLRCVEDYLKIGLPAEAEAMLLIEDDGDPVLLKKNIRRMEEICRERGTQVELAGNEKEAEDMWRPRKAISPALGRIRPRRFNEDVTVLRSRMEELIRVVSGICKRYQVINVNFGHAGDGNIHVNILYDPEDKEELGRAEEAIEEVLKAVVEMKGTISGEHGIGVAKAPYLHFELGDQGIAVMKKIKQAFDPNGIMNPGKIFASGNGTE
ncbi:MAG: FAD-binding protein [Deltaproteobacteria bacterium]|nr:MAG: FAD-binding protein [Deltaproteobacteria bacterium]